MNVQTIRDDTTTLDTDEVEALEDQLRGPLLREGDAWLLENNLAAPTVRKLE
ncbi:MAG: hypothetical protein V5A22_01635 [Salinivenus sp.]